MKVVRSEGRRPGTWKGAAAAGDVAREPGSGAPSTGVISLARYRARVPFSPIENAPRCASSL